MTDHVAVDEPLPPHQTMVLVAAMMGVVLVSLDVSVVNVAIYALQRSFDVGTDGLQWIVSIYTLTYAVFLLTAGALSDRFGPRSVFLGGTILFTLASLVCGIAPSFAILLIARAVKGIGAALLVPSSMALLQLTYPEPAQRARAVGLWAGAGSLALAAGPLIGGALIGAMGWRIIFLLNGPVGLMGIWLAFRHAPRSSLIQARTIDLPGQIFAALSLGSLMFTLIEAGAGKLSLAQIIAGSLFSCVLFMALLLIEARSRHPMVPLSIFSSGPFSAALTIGAIINFVFYGLIFIFSLFFQTVQHRSAFETGVTFLPMTALIMVVNVIAGRMIGRLGLRPVMLGGLLVAAVGYSSMILIDAETSYAAIVPSFLAAGIGIALTVPAIMTTALAEATLTRTGIASGIINAGRQVGGAIGVALFGSIVGSAASSDFVTAMHVSIAMAGLVLVVAFLIALMFMSRQSKPRAPMT